MASNYYETLGVENDADYEDIKRAWREKARQWHPDKFLSAEEKLKAHERFVEIMEAYLVLIDVNKRARYDSWMTWGAQTYRKYTGYENASPAADQNEAKDMYQVILGQTPWEFTQVFFVILIMFLLLPFTLLAVFAFILVFFNFAKGKSHLGFWGITLAFYFLLANLFLLRMEILFVSKLYNWIRRLIKLVIVIIRGRRIHAIIKKNAWNN